MVHRTKLKRFDFKCPCCNEVIFSSGHFFEKPPFKIVGQTITRGSKTVKMPPTLAYVFTLLLATHPIDIDTDTLTSLISDYSAGKPKIRNDSEFVTRGNVAIYIFRLKAFYSDLGFEVINSAYKRYGLIIHDSPAT